MSKEAQDKIWSDLSEKSKKKVLARYDEAKRYGCASDINCYEDLFGEHNLKPKPQIKTWEDFLKEFHKETDWNPKNEFADLTLYGMDDKIKSKIIATAKIAKLIELGYGGTVTKEEWENNNCRKYVVEYYPQDGRKFVESDYCIGEYRFIAFHTRKQRDEFMSYPENRKLVEQFFML